MEPEGSIPNSQELLFFFPDLGSRETSGWVGQGIGSSWKDRNQVLFKYNQRLSFSFVPYPTYASKLLDNKPVFTLSEAEVFHNALILFQHPPPLQLHLSA
jgi:hypothetical protein